MAGLVVDASVALCLAFRDEGLPYGVAAVDAIVEGGAVTPSIFWYEVRNALVVSERRNRITQDRSNAFLTLLGDLPISIVALPPPPDVLDLARQLQLSVYDAAYLELAVREALPLASLDKALIAAAARVRVHVWQAGP